MLTAEAAVLKVKITALKITVECFFGSWQTNAAPGGGCRPKEFHVVIRGDGLSVLLVLFHFYDRQMENVGLSPKFDPSAL